MTKPRSDKQMHLFDTHCHLDFPDFDMDRDDVIAHSKKVGVEGIVLVGVAAGMWSRMLNLARTDNIYHVALGLHPMYLLEHKAEHIQALQDAVTQYKPIAIGEIGLDYFLTELNREKQEDLFVAQLQVAKAADLPVILHVRKAHDQVLGLLRKHKIARGIVHAFSGSEQHAEHYIKLGFKLGIGGVVTLERANKLRRIAAHMPLEAMVLESDPPDLSPASRRGQRNSPEYLPEVVTALSLLRSQDEALIAETTTRNARELFALSR